LRRAGDLPPHLPIAATRDLLDVLVDAHLDFVRYAMHDFVRLFVRESPPPDADAAVRRALVGSQLYGVCDCL
jgi:hypothetical protein